jgi:hypothetical protein
MADKETHLLAAEADGLNKELAEIAIKVIDLSHEMPPRFGLIGPQKELVEIYSWLEPESLEKRIRNSASTTHFTSSEIRIHILHHVLLDIIANYVIPYKTNLWYKFKHKTKKEGFKGIWKLAKKNYEARISYGPYGEILIRTNKQNLNYIDIFAEALNVCQVWFYYRYRHTITLSELKYELRKWGIWAGRMLCKRYRFDENSFLDFLNLH